MPDARGAWLERGRFTACPGRESERPRIVAGGAISASSTRSSSVWEQPAMAFDTSVQSCLLRPMHVYAQCTGGVLDFHRFSQNMKNRKKVARKIDSVSEFTAVPNLCIAQG